MDTTVRGIGERVVAALEADGHAKLTIVQYRNAIRWLVILAQERGEEYSPALGAEFAVMTADLRTGKVFSPKPPRISPAWLECSTPTCSLDR